MPTSFPPLFSPLDVEFIPTYSQGKHQLMLLSITSNFYKGSIDHSRAFLGEHT